LLCGPYFLRNLNRFTRRSFNRKEFFRLYVRATDGFFSVFLFTALKK